MLEPPQTAAREWVGRTESGQVSEATGHFPLFDPLGSGIDLFGPLLSEELRPSARLGRFLALGQATPLAEVQMALSQAQGLQQQESVIRE